MSENKKQSFLDVLNEYFEKRKFLREKKKIVNNLKKYNIEDYEIHSDLSVTVNGSVFFQAGDTLKECPFNFREVTGNFTVTMTTFTTLKGCPKKIGKSFRIEFSRIKNLDFGPEEVGGNYTLFANRIDSLRSPLQKLGGKIELIDDQVAKIPEFINYYNGKNLTIDLETVNEIYSFIDLNEKLEQTLPSKSIVNKRNKI